MQKVRVDSAAQSDSFPYAKLKSHTHGPVASLSTCSSDLRSMDAEPTFQTPKLIIFRHLHEGNAWRETS
jgi:hypothetical protein